MAEHKHLTSKQLAGCISLLRAANTAEAKIEGIRQKIGETYENIILIMKQADIPWTMMTAELQAGFGDWPTDEKGVKIGLKALLRDKDENGRTKYEPAVWLNRFMVYRNRYVGYDKLRTAPAPPVKISEITDPEERKAVRIEQAEKETEKRISTAHAINMPLVVQALRELMTFAHRTHNRAAEGNIKALAKNFGISEDAVFELNSVVIPPKGDVYIPEEASVH